MNRRNFLTALAATPIAARASYAAGATGAVPGLILSPERSRYKLTLDRVLHGTGPAYTPDFLLEDIHATPGRRFTEFSGDVSGRWIGALASASRTYGEAFPALDLVVHRILPLQHPEGYFGETFHFNQPNDRDLALLWGNGRLLVGLMEYHGLTQNAAVLASARRLGDFLIRIGPRFNSQEMADAFGAAHFASSYICWTQQTEGLAALYTITRDARYRDLCSAISERIERRPADHVHGYLCSLRGTLDLYNVTGDKPLLERVETAWQDVTQSPDALVTGGVPEAWSPKRLRTEGCAECDWLRLNLALWRTTGDAKYLETAEHTMFNEFSMNQFATGDFGHAILDESGVPQVLAVRAWWCCTLHGLRVFPDLHRSAFRATEKILFYDLPIDSAFETKDLSLAARSSLATDGTILVTVKRAPDAQTLEIRKPKWAEALRITVNGKAVEATSIPIRAGDTLKIEYTMRLRESTFAEGQRLFQYGPWLLGAPSAANPGYFNELHPKNLLDAATAAPAPILEPSAFAVPIASTRFTYLPAEFPEQPSHVTLRAVAEQTGMPTTPWQIAFHTEKSS